MTTPNDTNEPSPASAGSQGMDVSALLDAIGDCLAQVDPFDRRCVVVLNTPERRKAHKALWQLKQMAESCCLRLLPEERSAIEAAIVDVDLYSDDMALSDAEVKQRQAALRALLERTIPALTDEEQEAVEWCVFQQWVPQQKAVALRRLLERTK